MKNNNVKTKMRSLSKISLGASITTLGVSFLLSLNAEAQSSSSCDNYIFGCSSLWQERITSNPCSREICWFPGVLCDTYCGWTVDCIDGHDFSCGGTVSCNVTAS